MKCIKCEQELSINDSFCSKCGSSQTKEIFNNNNEQASRTAPNLLINRILLYTASSVIIVFVAITTWKNTSTRGNATTELVNAVPAKAPAAPAPVPVPAPVPANVIATAPHANIDPAQMEVKPRISDTSAIKNTNISFKCKAFIITNEQTGKSKTLTDDVFDYYFLNGDTASEIASTGKKSDYKFVEKIAGESTVYKYARQDGSVTSEIFFNFQKDGRYLLASSLSAQRIATITTISNCLLNR